MAEEVNCGVRVLWVNPSFADYRVPVYVELDRLLGGGLTVLFSKVRTPGRVVRKLEAALGSRAKGMVGERSAVLGRRHSDFANESLRIPYQPGLLSSLLRLEADVVIGEGFYQWTPAALAKKICQRVPLVIAYERTAHTERHCPWWRVGYRKLVIRRADAALCNGSLCAQYVRELGMPAARIVTGGMAADSEWLSLRCAAIGQAERESARAKLGLSRPVFLYLGRMIPRKGVAELLQGWQLYSEQRPFRGTLLLAGDGPGRPELERWVKDRRVPGVVFAGPVEYERVPEAYGVADAFIIATLEDNWSLVVPEAMACGLPVLCSKYNGCWPELVREGENGWIFDPTRPKEIAQCLRVCVANEPKLRKMGQLSRRIEASFSPKRAALAALRACEVAASRGLR